MNTKPGCRHNLHNLTLKERTLLKDLQGDTSIVIKNSDKGGAVVILDAQDYLREADRQLSHTNIYTRIVSNPTSIYTQRLKQIIKEATSIGILSPSEAINLVPSHPVTPIFHHLPKIHKHDVPIQGRPIAASIGSLGELLGNLTDTLLHTLVTRIPSHLRDTKHTIHALEGHPVEKNYKWVVCDVKSLYSCIPHN